MIPSDISVGEGRYEDAQEDEDPEEDPEEDAEEDAGRQVEGEDGAAGGLMDAAPALKPVKNAVGVTGHRPDKLGGWDPLHPVVGRVKQALRAALIETWPSYLVTGMALGVDQWAAQEALELGIPFVAALPCDGMEQTWPLPSQERFHELLSKARQIVVVSPGPYKPWKLQRRNEWVVDNCELLLAVHDGSPGGTYNCIEYAKSVQRPIRHLSWFQV